MNLSTTRPLFAIGGCLLLAFTMSACSSASKIRADYDRGADFGSYTTYNFVENAGPRAGNYESFFTQYMRTAIELEMENRGYTKSDNPDLLINFNGIMQDKTKVSTSHAPPPMHGGGYYGYRGARYGTWGGYGYSTQTHVSQYTEGTFNIDIIDSKQQQLIWEAVGVGKVSQKALENLEESIMKGVPRYFAQYPFRAGDPNPVVK